MAPNTSSAPSKPPEASELLLRLLRAASRPLKRFLQIEAASGILLLTAAAIALLLANSRWAEPYHAFWQTQVGIRIGAVHITRSLEWVVNDGLMVIFFFVVGLEIRRELHHGELCEWRRASLPAAAAVGGMLVPAALYASVASAPGTQHGWGVPMATDIAFAVGILTLLGKRVPAGLRVLLLALAVIDDLGAILVIALFYSSGVALSGLGVAAIGVALLLGMQRFGVRPKLAYVPPALVIWAGVYNAGVHPSIAGVIVGLLTPVRAWYGVQGFLTRMREELTPLRGAELSSHALAGRLREVDRARREAMAPAESLIETLHPWVAFGIMPLFALANAGVSLGGVVWDAACWHVVRGISLGLVLGKPIGVLLATALSLRLRVAALPLGIGPRHLIVLGVVAGVGFTMALFVAQLAFADAQLLAAAKLGVLGASAAAALLSLGLGTLLLPQAAAADAAQSADDAERSSAA